MSYAIVGFGKIGQALARTWGQLIFQDLLKKEQ
jgi:predicted dinucleotide-binding enzyme